MARSLLFILAIIIVIWAIRHIRTQAPAKQRQLLFRYSIYGLIAVIIGLVLNGKLHWLAAAIAALLPLAQKFILVAIRVLPFLNAWRNKRGQAQQQQQKNQQQPTAPMDLEQALKIFGLKNVSSKAEIAQRHRELMQKNHPDRGGSDYLAAQINAAKDILINHLKK
ncbi:MAG: hypothetical protein KTR20_00645 [Cellvibrionaceae bacterium]|nr:hypothetical protein [Cellvibrionaceae bacterium]